MTIEKRIEKIESEICAIGIAEKDVLTFEEACMYSGMSHSCLYKLTSKRRIPHYKPGGKMIYFDRGELKSWLLQNRIATDEEISAKASAYTLSRGKAQAKRN